MDSEMPFNPAVFRSGGQIPKGPPKTAAQQREINPKYAALRNVLDEAYLQASRGKGKERHGRSGLPFEEQRMLSITRLLDSEAGLAYQACKKVTEGLDLPKLDDRVAEMLGAINYIVGIVLFMREKQAELESSPAGRIDSEDAQRGGL